MRFVELPVFTADWRDLKLTDDDLMELKAAIMSAPARAPVIAGTGGLRKLRLGRPGRGKRGGLRVCYAHFPAYSVVILVAVYGKNEQEDLSAAEKRQVRALLKEIEELLG